MHLQALSRRFQCILFTARRFPEESWPLMGGIYRTRSHGREMMKAQPLAQGGFS
jgi:hypothetical protein